MTSSNPHISVIIASLSGSTYLNACLTSLANQQGHITSEIIVVEGVGEALPNHIQTQHPNIHIIPYSSPQTIAELRAIGLKKAQGMIVALTEDHCLIPPNWFVSIQEAHQKYTDVAIGGSVVNGAEGTLADQLAYVCEYGNFGVVPAGSTPILPGPNVSYKRTALTNIGTEFWEGHFHAQLQAQGHTLRSDPSLQVTHKKHFTLKTYLHERFHYSRWFAGHRVTNSTLTKRLFYLAASPLLPLLIFIRLVRRLDKSNWYLAPHIALVALVGTLGEGIGYALGKGNSAYHLK